MAQPETAGSSPAFRHSTALEGQARPRSLQRLNVVRACNLSDAGAAISLVRSREVVLLDCAALEQHLAQRLIDMVSGGLSALGGQLHRIGPSLLLACPALTQVQNL